VTLVLHMGALGDFAIAWPMLRALRRLQPSQRLVAAVSEGRRPWARAVGCDGRPLADETVSIDSPLFTPLFGDDRSRDDELRLQLGDHARVVSFLGSPDAHFHRRLREVIAGELIAIDTRPTAGLREPVFEQWTRQAPMLRDGCDEPWEPMEAGVRPMHRYAVIHPGSGGRDKCWPADRFEAVADALAGRGIEPVMIVGEVELERGLRPARFPARSPTPAELVSLLSGAAVFVGNDSGPAHVAAALGTPTVAVFRTTDPLVWGPRGRRVRTVGQGVPTVPARAPGTCPWGSAPTIIDPSVDEVLDAVRDLATQG